jgi:hypothetical protein
MSLLRVDFQELYTRHLCRHSQFGINVAHLVALYATWWAVYAAVYWLAVAALGQAEWVPAALAVLYFAVLVPNVPVRVLMVTAVFLALFVLSVLWVPLLPGWAFWVYLVIIPAFYKLQSWSHRVWTVERDMTEFNKKYTKGSVLFVVLLFYEIPLVLNYLVLQPGDWKAATVGAKDH